jgi:hypothetical protein
MTSRTHAFRMTINFRMRAPIATPVALSDCKQAVVKRTNGCVGKRALIAAMYNTSRTSPRPPRIRRRRSPLPLSSLNGASPGGTQLVCQTGGRVPAQGRRYDGSHSHRSKSPWGRAALAARTVASHPPPISTRSGVMGKDLEGREGLSQTAGRDGYWYAGCLLNRSGTREGRACNAGLGAVLGKTRRTES